LGLAAFFALFQQPVLLYDACSLLLAFLPYLISFFAVSKSSSDGNMQLAHSLEIFDFFTAWSILRIRLIFPYQSSEVEHAWTKSLAFQSTHRGFIGGSVPKTMNQNMRS
jgi:hypothetical protein